MEEEEVVTVENKGGKGNPNHAPKGAPGGKGGQFVSKEESGSVEASAIEGGDDFGVVEIKEAPRTGIGNKFASFLMQKKEQKDKEANDFMDKIKVGVDEEHQTFYGNLSREERLALLYDSPKGYDKKKLKFATDGQLMALLYAEAIENKRVQLEQELEVLKKEKQKIDDEMNSELEKLNTMVVSGVWKDQDGFWTDKRPSDYVFLSTSGSIDRKREYYNGVLGNADSPLSEKFKATQKLKELDEFVKAGEDYETLKKDLMLKNLDTMEKIEDKISEISKESLNYELKSTLSEEAQKYLDTFVDVEATYSKERKANAVWFKNFDKAYAMFSPKAQEHWGLMNAFEHNLIHEYTGSGYSRFNKPLRKIYHNKEGYSFGGEAGMETFSSAVNNLTNAIDKCTWDQDIWVNRYIASYTKMFKLSGAKEAKELEYMSDNELQSLVGTSFTDGGFFSAGAAKGTGYKTGNIVFNIYCPKGTKMAYVAPYTTASKSENEMILQRGYSYRITKVEKRKDGYFFLDMEVILGSDNNKPVGNDLKKLGNEYYYKPRHEEGEAYE